MSTGGPTAKRKPIRITVGGRKRRRPTKKGATGGAAAPANTAAARQRALPAILRSLPKTDQSDPKQQEDGNDAAAKKCDDEYGAFPGGDGDIGDALPCDTLLALRSLVARSAAALCPLDDRNSEEAGWGMGTGMPFVLKPMLHYALLSTVSTTASSANVDSAGGWGGGFGGSTTETAPAKPTATADESNRLLSANASTGVNVELDTLRRSNAVRLVQLHGTGDAESDVAVMEIGEYERGAREALRARGGRGGGRGEKNARPVVESEFGGRSMVSDGRGGWDEEAIEWFVLSLPRWTGKSVTQRSIREGLESHHRLHLDAPPSKKKSSKATPLPSAWDLQSVIDHLVRSGLLLPRSSGSSSLRESETSYWFTLPGMGLAAKQIAAGRARVLTKLKRSSYGEVRRSALEVGNVVVGTKKGRAAGQSLVRSNDGGGGSGMSAAFHIRDLLSRGGVRLRDTPAGQFVKLAS